MLIEIFTLIDIKTLVLGTNFVKCQKDVTKHYLCGFNKYSVLHFNFPILKREATNSHGIQFSFDCKNYVLFSYSILDFDKK